MRRVVTAAMVAMVLAAAGCGGGDDGSADGASSSPDAGSTSQGTNPQGPVPAGVFRIVGQVWLRPSGQAAVGGVTAATDATVRAWAAGGTPVETSTDGSGAFTLDVPLDAPGRVVVEVSASDTVPWFGAANAAPGGSWKVTAQLSAREELQCAGAVCSLQSGALVLDGLPEGTTGWGRAFDPTVDADAFPGAFADDQGNLLVSSAFMVAELTDSTGAPVHEFDQAVTMRLAIPRTTWSTLRDLQPGSGAIEVPLYRFDEDTGQWVRDGQGQLTDGNGKPLDESKLSALHDGSYAGVVFAQGQVTHMSWWNVDWPVDTHAALRLCVEFPDGTRVVGATVTLRGVTYQGTSEPATTDAQGCVCIEGMRSENPGEDIDGNGTTGETHRVAITVTHEGKIYKGWVFDTPAAQGTCPDDAVDEGPLVLDADHEAHLMLCHFHVRMLDKAGRPIGGAQVMAFPDGDDAVQQACLDKVLADPTGCPLSSTTDDNGEADVCGCMLDALSVVAIADSLPSEYGPMTVYSVETFSECPAEPATLYPSFSAVQVANAQVHVDGDNISWDPPLAALGLEVYPPGADTTDATKARWAISSALGFEPPIRYGELPEGAFAYVPASGAPAPMQSGDLVIVRGYGQLPDGTSYAFEAQGTVP